VKRIIIILLTTWLFLRSGAIDTLFALFFAGSIPGTGIVISPGLMLTSYIVIGALLAHHLIFYGKYVVPTPVKSQKRPARNYSKA
jgi:hypothetical protein